MPIFHIFYADRLGSPRFGNYNFTDPQVAQLTARGLSREIGEKLMIKAVVDDGWKRREYNRSVDGTYRPLPWAGATWWHQADVMAIWKDHFPHPSLEKPGWIAYTASAADGERDKQSIVRCGSYLKKYFEAAMNKYGVSERNTVNQFMLAYGPIEIKFAATEEEILKTYEYGPDTCMKGKHWHNGKNPAYIYAAGDLQVAYIGDLNTKVTARTLVWPEKKIHSRVYGDIARLTQGLTRLGYKWGAPIGAKLKRVEVNPLKFNANGRGYPTHCFVAPYIDKKNMQGGGHLGVIDKGDHLEICEDNKPGSHHCGLADGLTGIYVPREEDHPTFTCEHCDEGGHRELINVIHDAADTDNASQWCAECVESDAFFCHRSESHFSSENVERVTVGGADWAEYYAEMYAKKCEMTGKLFRKEHIVSVYMNGEPKPKTVYLGWARERDLFRSDLSSRYYLGVDRVRVLAQGGTVYNGAKPELHNHAFQCDSCEAFAMIDTRNQIDGGDKLHCDRCYRGKGKPAAKQGLYSTIAMDSSTAAYVSQALNNYKVRL